MTNKKFEELVEEQFTICNQLLCNKSQEYDFGKDRLHSFKVAAELLKTTPEEALLGYLTKHIMSIYDMIPEVNNFSFDKFMEKITDTINYLLLLKGLLYERKIDNSCKGIDAKDETN